jgi:hypothetical protein
MSTLTFAATMVLWLSSDARRRHGRACQELTVNRQEEPASPPLPHASMGLREAAAQVGLGGVLVSSSRIGERQTPTYFDVPPRVRCFH